jgi:hypothetical protein
VAVRLELARPNQFVRVDEDGVLHEKLDGDGVGVEEAEEA